MAKLITNKTKIKDIGRPALFSTRFLGPTDGLDEFRLWIVYPDGKVEYTSRSNTVSIWCVYKSSRYKSFKEAITEEVKIDEDLYPQNILVVHFIDYL